MKCYQRKGSVKTVKVSEELGKVSDKAIENSDEAVKTPETSGTVVSTVDEMIKAEVVKRLTGNVIDENIKAVIEQKVKSELGRKSISARVDGIIHDKAYNALQKFNSAEFVDALNAKLEKRIDNIVNNFDSDVKNAIKENYDNAINSDDMED